MSSSSDFRFIVITPPAMANPTIAIAATRAGFFGVLDLSFVPVTVAQQALDKLAHFATGAYGVRLVDSSAETITLLTNTTPTNLSTLIIDRSFSVRLARRLRKKGFQIWIEVGDVAPGQHRIDKLAAAFIARSKACAGWAGQLSAENFLRSALHRRYLKTPVPVFVQGGVTETSLNELYDLGAAGVVLSEQLLLMRESQLSSRAKAIVQAWPNLLHTTIHDKKGWFSGVIRPNSAIATTLANKEKPRDFAKLIGWQNPTTQLTPLGKDTQYAPQLANHYRSVSNLLTHWQTQIDQHKQAIGQAGQVSAKESTLASPANIAIVGIECLLPKATNKTAYWENIVNAVYAIEEVPATRWSTDLYFDADRQARDKIYSRWGGFLEEVPFDPLEFGMPPNSLQAIDPMQLLALKVAKAALADAGYVVGDHTNTGVILGASGGLGDVGTYYMIRTMLPTLVGDAAADIIAELPHLPEWSEDSFAGLLPNVTAGRIANRFDFGGVNFTVDAACGSSLAAVHLAVRELVNGSADMMVVGGVDTVQSPFGYMCFSKTMALSPQGVPRVFDADGDGIVISEGIAMLVLKRLADAERDGDRIYAVIQGSAGSSDGKALGLTAPRAEGQMLALERVYARSGIDPTTVGLFEAHGTGTAVGDRTEAQAVGRFLTQKGATANRYPLGSVKSMIGHTKAAAGVAGLVKIALALHHKILPPTLNVSTPNPKSNFGTGPLYINSETRPWVHGSDHPRRAAVSAFGFGGTNFHVLAEEYQGSYFNEHPALQKRSSELFVFSGTDSAEITTRLTLLASAIDGGAAPSLADLAYTYWLHFSHNDPVRLAIVATSLDDLRAKIKPALLGYTPDEVTGIFWGNGVAAGQKLAFLFPGQGSQYPNMFRDLALHFKEIRSAFDHSDRILSQQFGQPLSLYVFPQPAFNKATRTAQAAALTATNIAQPALGAAETGLLHLLTAFDIQPDMLAGHSYGEYVALHAAGVIDADTLASLSEARGRCIVEATTGGLGTMAAVSADKGQVEAAIKGLPNVWVANFNSPVQTIISGSEAGVANALTKLEAAALSVRRIPVAAAFHSPIVAPAREQFATYLEAAEFSPPQYPVYANTTARPHASEADAIRGALIDHIVRPVRFVEQIEAMYAAGARVFVECGPRNVLTKLCQKILGEREFTAIYFDHAKEDGVTRLHAGLGQLLASGVPVDLDRLFAHRAVRVLDLRRLVDETKPQPLSPTAWLLSGGAIRKQQVPRVIVSAELLNQNFAQATTPLAATTATESVAAADPTPQIIATQPHQPPVSDTITAFNPPAKQLETSRSNPSMLLEQAQTDPSIAGNHHELMEYFLQTQKSIMLAALGGQDLLPTQASVRGEAVVPQQVEQYDDLSSDLRNEPSVISDVASVPRSILVDVAVEPPVLQERVFSAEIPILITDDGRGIAQQLALRIREAGGDVVIASDVDMLSGQWSGVIHLASLFASKPLFELNLDQWLVDTQRVVKNLLPLTQNLLGEHPFLLAAIASAQNPLHGGVSGFIKTAAQEMPAAHIVCVDVAMGEESDSAETVVSATVNQLWAELNSHNTPPIIRYRAGQRYAQRRIAHKLDQTQARTEITADDVILVTGGARGITAQAAIALAQHVAPTLILVGRSIIVDLPESAATAAIQDHKSLKAALIAQARELGQPVELATIEREFNALLKQREMRATVAAIEAAGATVRYHAADVRDVAAMAQLVAATWAEFGLISGLIHGAGVIEDKLIGDKSAASFARVFDTKSDSLFILTQLLEQRDLKFVALFSSISGALGNRGQADYAAANDLMNHLATYLDQQWDTHVVACCWGPWATEGMVSPALEAQFAEQGIELIAPELGCQALLDEVRYGSDAVVIYAGGQWSGHTVLPTPATLDLAYPLLTHSKIERNATFIQVERSFDLTRDPYLNHHRLDGIPVLPMAVATEWMAEVAQMAWPELNVLAIRDLEVLAGIKFKDDAARDLRVVVRVVAGSAESDRSDNHLIAQVQLLAENGRVHYRATVELAAQLPPAERHQIPDQLEIVGRSVAECYETWLFHGSTFQAISAIIGINTEQLVLAIEPSEPNKVIPTGSGQWLLDPIIVDAGLQGALIWARQQLDVTPVPLGFKAIERFAPLAERPVTAHLQFVRDELSQTLTIDIIFVDVENKVVAKLLGIHGQYSSAFNRLGGYEKYAPFSLVAG